MKIINFLKDLIAPKKCYSCKKEWCFLCRECFLKLENFDSICYVCKWNTNNFEVHEKCKKEVYYDKIVVLSHYKNKIIKQIIKDFKFYSKKDIKDDFWYYLGELFFNNEIYKNYLDYVIINPPMSFFKKLKRWYNQSELLAKIISKDTNIKLEKNIIIKYKKTRQQSNLSRIERLENLKDCFKINKKLIDKIDNKNIIIVDDVISTGTTINEISKTLKQNWAKKVIWLIIASD